MLAYAFQVLKQPQFDQISSEDFENVQDLFAAILAKGIAQQLKRGLYLEYVSRRETLSVLRGKLDLCGTLRNSFSRVRKLSCDYDELSENNYFNQIIKTTAGILMYQPSVSLEHSAKLKKVLMFFSGIDTLDPFHINWSKLQYHRNNRGYEMLLNICYFVITGLLLTTEKGQYKMVSFLDDLHMERLYERFVLAYYCRHYPKLTPSASLIKWDIDEGSSEFLPAMRTDITLTHAKKALIIDTKYYTRAMQEQTRFDSMSLRSDHLYQIFAYVKNKDVGDTGNVAGMLLYAKTSGASAPDKDVKMKGSLFFVRSLDLNVPFSSIAAQLDGIVQAYFGAQITKAA